MKINIDIKKNPNTFNAFCSITHFTVIVIIIEMISVLVNHLFNYQHLNGLVVFPDRTHPSKSAGW